MTRQRASRQQHNAELGRRGEDLACEHLERRGHRILDRNWRCRRGEIDVVSIDRGTIVVVEVKTRSSCDFGHPFDAIHPRKLERLHRLGWDWCQAHGRTGVPTRVDAVAVLISRDGLVGVEHLEAVR